MDPVGVLSAWGHCKLGPTPHICNQVACVCVDCIMRTLSLSNMLTTVSQFISLF
jgi:hypothetical protein